MEVDFINHERMYISQMIIQCVRKSFEMNNGSDSYMQRGSQTLNLTQKSKALNFQGFTQETKDVTASKADIDDASKEEKITNAKRQELAYLKSIDDIMAEKLKNPNSLFDAEALASHISIVTSQSATKMLVKAAPIPRKEKVVQE